MTPLLLDVGHRFSLVPVVYDDLTRDVAALPGVSFTRGRAQVRRGICRCSSMASPPPLPLDRFSRVPSPPLLPEIGQSGLLLGFAVTVVGLALGAEHLLATIR